MVETPNKNKEGTGPIVSDILKGNFSEVHVPEIEIPGSAPLVYKDPEELLQEVWESDLYDVEDIEEEFLLFPGEIVDKKTRR